MHSKLKYVQNSRYSRYFESLKYSLHRSLCNCVTLTYSQPLDIQALAYLEPDEYEGPFFTELCVTLSYSELEAYSKPCQISIMENFIQNHV